jgi:Na+/H+ antiporter
MKDFETLLALLIAAVILAAFARRVGAPYPVFLAVGGALLAFVPGAPTFTVPPELALAVFIAPVLLDAAYDTSVRDLKDNWLPITSLVVVAVSLTVAAVAVVTRALVPEIPWAAAVALGAAVAPPDAAAATAVLRPLRPPHRILTILEGESLLNDASALLIYRVAVEAAGKGFSIRSAIPPLTLGLAGSVVAGWVIGRLVLVVMDHVQHVPTAIIIQFVSTFGVWIVADRIGLSGVLTMVCYAVTLARTSPERTPARMRIPSYAVWDTAVFVLNVLAFSFIGLQLRPIVESLDVTRRHQYFVVAFAVLLTVIAVRVSWHMSFNFVIRRRQRWQGFHPPRPMLRPTIGSGLVISWAGMRGILSLAAALALPRDFPFRGMIVLTAFFVVLGTLTVQGLTLKTLLRALHLKDDDPVSRELDAARERALHAGLETIQNEKSPLAESIREEFTARMLPSADSGKPKHSAHGRIHRAALQAARQAVLRMRANQEIGDDAFHAIEEELDWLDMAVGTEPE